jgi:hypothetical protein
MYNICIKLKKDLIIEDQKEVESLNLDYIIINLLDLSSYNNIRQKIII